MAPGKYVSIAPKKSRECLADCGTGEGSNLGCSFTVRVVKKHLFKFFYGLRRYSVFFYAHGLEVVIHFHHGYVTFACDYLISSQLSHSVVGRKLNHQVVG